MAFTGRAVDRYGLRVAAWLLAALAGAGLVAQTVAGRRDRRRFPAPGTLVDVGGHRLHLHVAGSPAAAPTVVLEAGMASGDPVFLSTLRINRESFAAAHPKVEMDLDGVRVAVDPAIPCHRCDLCLQGHPNLCRAIVFAASLTAGLGSPPAIRARALHPTAAS